ncbi:hypothetical protein AC578_5723 [Pseudocercospora eumusae]|uniref:Uncharacterized protein n=1 Tax=Pseudocercospora eumusae TaxID=321146 RepID=A0A139HEU6_9PEZI|nr:hypothetical protein AC578_5723 [Pseudocercospora eumusae]
MTSDKPFHPAHRYSFQLRESDSSLPSYTTEDEVTATGDTLPSYPPKAAAGTESNAKDLESGPAVIETRPRTNAQTEAEPRKCEQSTAPSDDPKRLEWVSASSIVSLFVWGFAGMYLAAMATVTTGEKLDCNRKAENGNKYVRYRCMPANYFVSVAFAICIFKASDKSVRALIRCTTEGPNSGLRAFLSALVPAVTVWLAIGAFAFMTYLPRHCFEERCMEESLCSDIHGHPIPGTTCYGDLINGTEKY